MSKVVQCQAKRREQNFALRLCKRPPARRWGFLLESLYQSHRLHRVRLGRLYKLIYRLLGYLVAFGLLAKIVLCSDITKNAIAHLL